MVKMINSKFYRFILIFEFMMFVFHFFLFLIFHTSVVLEFIVTSNIVGEVRHSVYKKIRFSPFPRFYRGFTAAPIAMKND